MSFIEHGTHPEQHHSWRSRWHVRFYCTCTTESSNRFSEAAVLTTIKCLPSSQSPCDPMPANLLKVYNHLLTPFLTYLFNLSVSNSAWIVYNCSFLAPRSSLLIKFHFLRLRPSQDLSAVFVCSRKSQSEASIDPIDHHTGRHTRRSLTSHIEGMRRRSMNCSQPSAM